MPNITRFVNGPVCLQGRLEETELCVDVDSGLIVDGALEITSIHDVQEHIIAPAFLELQTNGCAGFHFTHFQSAESYQRNLFKVSEYLVSTGVGSYWATIPTVSSDVFKKILPELRPQAFDGGAELLGAHCEGPWLNPEKKGAHDASLMRVPQTATIEEIYGQKNPSSIIKMVTLAPELEGSSNLIRKLSKEHGIVVSLGHSASTFDTGMAALDAGARTLTHVFNAMNPLNHRVPGLVGLIASSKAPYYSIIPDGIHLHPATVAVAFRSNPEKCILITDSIEMAGLPDGLYPGHAQIPHSQRKTGNKVTIEGTDTLIGSCIGLDECVRNLCRFTGCTLAEAVRCVTENVANLMGLRDRGMLEAGRRADFVIMDRTGNVKSVYIGGRKVFGRA